MRAISILLLVSALSLASASVRGETDSRTYREPETGVEFPRTLPGGFVLLGAGVREKWGFDVYAAALYVDRAQAVQAMANAPDPAQPIIFGTFPRKLILHFMRSGDGKKVQDIFRESLLSVLTAEEKEKCKEDIERYMKAVESGVKKGYRVEFSYKDAVIRVLLGEKVIYETSNIVMIRAMFKTWFGTRPVSAPLKKSFFLLMDEALR